VSSNGQKEDLKRQVSKMQEEYPNHRIITDIGSGINFKRPGLRTILELTFARQLKEIVVSYRDRLCRFAFELLEWIFLQHGVKLVVLDSNMDSSTNSELADDLLAIVNVFNCRVNGRRKYKTKKESKDRENKEDDNTNSECNEEN
jgi:predicted site-specific integrase-resolvase